MIRNCSDMKSKSRSIWLQPVKEDKENYIQSILPPHAESQIQLLFLCHLAQIQNAANLQQMFSLSPPTIFLCLPFKPLHNSNGEDTVVTFKYLSVSSVLKLHFLLIFKSANPFVVVVVTELYNKQLKAPMKRVEVWNCSCRMKRMESDCE